MDIVKRRAGLTWVVLVGLLAGVLATGIGYQFGAGNHVEQLPPILRVLDPGYLSQDFFTNAASGYGPRFFYVQTLALLARLIPLEAVFFLGTLASNMLVGVITGLAARDLFGSGAGLLAPPLLLSGVTLKLGGATFLTNPSLLPQLVVMPCLLGSIWAALRRRPVWMAIGAGCASFLQPLIGLETGLALLFVLGLEYLDVHRRGWGLTPGLIGAGLILGLCGLIWWPFVAGGSNRIPDQTFIEILAYSRHPHHYVPSFFPSADYIDLLLVLVAAGIAWRSLWATLPDRRQVLDSILHIIGVVLVLCVAGYVFVELIPSRLWTTLQTFRLLYIVNWVVRLLFAAVIARGVVAGHWPRAGYLCVGTCSSLALGVLFGLDWARERARHAQPAINLLAFGIGVASLMLFVMLNPLALRYGLLLLFALAAGLAVRGKSYGRTLAILIVGGTTGLMFLGLVWPDNPLRAFTGFVVTEPVYSLADADPELLELARAARAMTPTEAVFLIPPDWGRFRLLAQRAIVVDFKAFPFSDTAMLEWQRRMVDCYGHSDLLGEDALPALASHYRALDDADLQTLYTRYGVTYAVLYADTATALPVLASTATYQIIRVE